MNYGKRKKKQKGQVGIEYLTITAFLLLVAIILFVFGFVTFSETAKRNKADNAVKSLASAANQVYALGPGNIVFVETDFPEGIQSGSTFGQTIQLKLSSVSGTNDVFERTNTKLSIVNLPTLQGKHYFKIEMTNTPPDYNVLITETTP
ncbi:MAG: hypothetical protein Q7S21_04635 [archaeon]|nr:hypothetical protein [archaeon]